MSRETGESQLSPYRVLDLTDFRGFLCGKILADFGADVIKIERPGGDTSRNIGPFYHDVSDPEKSLFWFAYNTSKKGITLDIENRDGQEIFKRLAKTADVVIESFPPGHMEKLGLAYPALKDINPGIILTSITPFGQTGPYQDYKASDIVTMAMGGLMYISGYPDRAPLRCIVDQSYPQAGAQAAGGTMIALYYRELTGKGQQVDVSMQECILPTLYQTLYAWELENTIMGREGVSVARRPIVRRNIFACKDGYIAWQVMVGQFGRRQRALVEYMDSEGMAGDLKKVNWEAIDYNELKQEQLEHWEQVSQAFFLTHTKAELHEEAVKRGILLCPVATCEDILRDKQLASRHFWIKVEHPELEGSLTYPGAPAQLSEAPWRISRRAPLIGEHNEEIYQEELGLSDEEMVILKQGNVI